MGENVSVKKEKFTAGKTPSVMLLALAKTPKAP
jgi:hypothetical protein